MSPQRLLVTLPISLSVAAIAHGLRFGDEHAFGEGYHDWLCAALVAGLPALAWGLFARAVAELPMYADGSVLAERLARLLPGHARLAPLSATISLIGSLFYLGVERLEADGDRSYIAALAIIAALSLCAAIAMQRLLLLIAGVTIALFRRLVCAAPPAARSRPKDDERVPLTPRLERSALRFSRAPPSPA